MILSGIIAVILYVAATLIALLAIGSRRDRSAMRQCLITLAFGGFVSILLLVLVGESEVNGLQELTPLAVVVMCLIVGMLVASLAVGRRPSRTKLRWSLAGAGLGAILGWLFFAFFSSQLISIAYRTAVYVAQRGFTRQVFPWCVLYVWSACVFTGMGVGGATGWWIKTEKAK